MRKFNLLHPLSGVHHLFKTNENFLTLTIFEIMGGRKPDFGDFDPKNLKNCLFSLQNFKNHKSPYLNEYLSKKYILVPHLIDLDEISLFKQVLDFSDFWFSRYDKNKILRFLSKKVKND